MARFKSAAQRRAVFARLAERLRGFATKHPLLTGYGAATATMLAAGVGTALAWPRLIRRIGGAGLRASQLRKLFRATRKLYPGTAGLLRSRGGGGFTSKGLLGMVASIRGAGFASKEALKASSLASPAEAISKLVTRSKPPLLVSRPTVMVPPFIPRPRFTAAGKEIRVPFARGRPVARVSPDFLAHELGHAAQFFRRGGRVGQVVQGVSRSVTAEPTALLASLAAQPAISRLPISEEKKRKLRIAAAAIPLVAATPMLAAEAGASMRGLKILKAAGASLRRLRRARRAFAATFGTYAAQAAPGVVGGGVTGALYLRRSKQKRRTAQ